MELKKSIKITIYLLVIFIFIISINSFSDNFKDWEQTNKVAEEKLIEKESFEQSVKLLTELNNEKDSIFHKKEVNEIHLRGVSPTFDIVKEDRPFVEGDEYFSIESVN